MKDFRLWLAGIIAGRKPPTREKLLEKILMKLSELAGKLTTIDNNVTEASAELLKLIEDLRAALGDVEIPAEAETLLNTLETKSRSLADVVQ